MVAPTPSAPEALWSKLPRHRFLLLFALALAAFFVIALVVILIVKPGATKPPCPPDEACGRPPTLPGAVAARPLVAGTVWRSSALGFSLEYEPRRWKLVSQGPRGVVLSFSIPQRPEVNLLLLVQGTPLRENSPAQLLQKQIATLRGDILGLRSDPSAKHTLLGPSIGYVTGNAVGGPYAGTLDTPQGPGPRIALLSMGATDGRISLVATAATTSAEQIRLPLMGLADSVLNTLHWPTGAEALQVKPIAAAPARTGRRPELAAAKPLDRFLARVKPRTPIDFTLVLRFRRAALDRYLRALHDPGSPSYRRFLSAGEIGERFGISSRELARLTRRLEAAGLEVTQAYPQRTALRVTGSAARVSALFRAALGEFEEPSGRVYRRPLRPPTIPGDLRRSVVGVTGLSNRSLAVPAAVPDGALAPKTTARAYNLEPLHARGIRGQGQTIAIISFDSFNDSDPKLFDRRFGLSGPPVRHRRVAGGTPVGENQVEVNLDIDVIRSIAPKAQIINYEGPNGGVGYGDMMNAVIADGKAEIASISWGNCDDLSNLNPAERASTLNSFRAAVARGISIFVASGDAGAYTCQRRFLNDHRLTVEFPSSTPYVISVGGTLLSTTADGSYFREYGWEDVLGNGGGGGGLNPRDPRPSWQRAPGVDNSFSNGKRQLPDVAAAADPDSGFFIVTSGELTSVGGTSAATPFWAASMLLIRQYAQQQGAGKLGFVAPILYRLASTRQPYPPFHDVVAGGNRYYRAGRGWDYATGLGSPNVWNLARDIVRDLKRR